MEFSVVSAEDIKGIGSKAVLWKYPLSVRNVHNDLRISRKCSKRGRCNEKTDWIIIIFLCF